MKYLFSLVLTIIFISQLSCDKETHVYNSVSGSWRCQEFNPLYGPSVYMVDIDRKRSDTTQYLLSNFHNQDSYESIEFIFAQLQDSSLIISRQAIAGIIVKSGIGKISNDFRIIEFDYSIFDGINDIEVKAIYSRPD